MAGFLRRNLTYANVMATTAVFIALGGVGYAAVTLPKNSVGTTQIKKNAVIGSKVKNNSLTGSDIKNNSIVSADIRNGSLNLSDFSRSAGKALIGPPGPAGGFDPARLVYVQSSMGDVPYGGTGGARASCPAGGRVIGGGAWTGSDVNVYASAPSMATKTDWVVYGRHTGSIPAPIGIYAYAICATG